MHRLLRDSQALGDAPPGPPGPACANDLLGLDLLGQQPQAGRGPECLLEIRSTYLACQVSQISHDVSLS